LSGDGGEEVGAGGNLVDAVLEGASDAETGDATDQSEEEMGTEESGNEDMEAEVLPEDTAESSELTETGE